MEINKDDIIQLIGKANTSADIGKIAYDTSLETAGVDSLDKANVLFLIEEEYQVKISDDEVELLDSVDSIAELLGKKLKAKE